MKINNNFKVEVSINKYEALALLFLPIILVPILIMVFLKNPMENNIFPRCIFHQFTGLYCPGCGVTRATFYLIHGNIIKAFHYNPMFIVFLPLIAYLYLLGFGIKINGKPIFTSKITVRFYINLLLVIIGFTILRNIPLFPFTFLAP